MHIEKLQNWVLLVEAAVNDSYITGGSHLYTVKEYIIFKLASLLHLLELMYYADSASYTHSC